MILCFRGIEALKHDFVMKDGHGKADIFLGFKLLFKNGENEVQNYAAWRFHDFFICIFMVGIK